MLCDQSAHGLFLRSRNLGIVKNLGKGCVCMSEITLQTKINAKKGVFLQTLKEQGVFIEYCPKRGYIYELVKPVLGSVTRVLVALKNGVLEVLQMDTVEGVRS